MLKYVWMVSLWPYGSDIFLSTYWRFHLLTHCYKEDNVPKWTEIDRHNFLRPQGNESPGNANGNHREIFGCNVVFRSGTTSTWRGTNLNMTTSLTSASLQNTSGNRICWCITGEFLNPSIKSGRPACPAWHIPGKAENMLVCQSSLVVVIIIYNFNNINITSALNWTLRKPWTSCFDVETGRGFANLESEDID